MSEYEEVREMYELSASEGVQAIVEAADRRITDMDDALHSAFQDYRDDFGDDSAIDDFDHWLALHVTCGKEMRQGNVV